MADAEPEERGGDRDTGGGADDAESAADSPGERVDSGEREGGADRPDETDGEPGAFDRSELAPLTLDEALSVIGEETRARIIVALGDAWDEDAARPDTVGFSELMERVDAEDSGRFNYHLDKLVGTFVEKREDGYLLRQPGRLVHRTIIAGTLTDREPIDPFPVDDCWNCDGTITATYRTDHIILFACEDCGEKADAMYLPARAFEERTTDEAVEAAFERTFHELAMMRRGVCFGCGGRVERDLRSEVGEVIEERFGYDAFATLACGSCNESFIAHPVRIAMTTPAVVGFFDDHGRDAARTRSWATVVDAATAAMTVAAETPVCVSFPFDLDDERLTLTLDEDLEVAAAERGPRPE
jgi:hypothetical protein